jgi:hypothetical protein
MTCCLPARHYRERLSFAKIISAGRDGANLHRVGVMDVAGRRMADIWQCPNNVCFTPESGHQLSALRCPLSAKSRHCAASLDHLIGELLQGKWNGQPKVR